jgi:hypothetical protein
VAYVKLCRAGMIDNKASTSTVAKAYGVTRRAVQNWTNEIACEPGDFFPAAATEAERARLISDEMPKAGERYRAWGLGPQNPRAFGKGRKRGRAKRARI